MKNEDYEAITLREMEVLQLLMKGYKNKQIAEKLCISEATVRFRLKSIYSKTGINSRTELVAWGIHQGF